MRKNQYRKLVICKDCGRERYNAARGLCNSCYNRAYFLSKEPIPCGRCGRERRPFSGGLCQSCYQIIRKYPNAILRGTPEDLQNRSEVMSQGQNIGAKSGKNWKGGRFVDTDGYVRILNPIHQSAKTSIAKRYLFEHRVVAEQALGRHLRKEEIVHHINLIKTDNRPENLLVLPNNSEHRKIHTQLEGLVKEAEQRLRELY